MSETTKIADWAFTPETGVLRRGDDEHRLEHRTASLLDHLARHAGELVSHADIIKYVWDERAVSPNSVAVVISDIRRALGDDPREPRYIETLPKRGYRLIAETAAAESAVPLVVERPSEPPRRAWNWPSLAAFGAVALVAVIAFAALAGGEAKPDRFRVYVAAAENQTGDAQYDPLTASVTELLAVELARDATFHVSEDPETGVIVSGNLILWDGYPAMSVYATSAEGEIIWSGMASGPETLLPGQVQAEIADLAAFVREQEPG